MASDLFDLVIGFFGEQFIQIESRLNGALSCPPRCAVFT